MSSDAVEIHGHGRQGPMLICCEHASKAVPPPLRASAADARWLETHWGYDIGAASVARILADRFDCAAVLAKFSRLVCDANREADAPTWIRTEIEGEALSFNQGLDAAERQRRATRYHAPYHAAIDALLGPLAASGADALLFSVHSFTPVFEDQVRAMELGVLFDRYEPIARRFATELEREGFKTALNEPYSGMDGLIFSAQRHGSAHNVVYLELEIRQDLLADEAACVEVAGRIEAALRRLRLRAKPRPSSAG